MSILLVYLCFLILLFIIILIIQSAKIRKLFTEPKNKVHFYVARDKNGTLWLYLDKPQRRSYTFLNPHGTCGNLMVNNFHFKYFGLNPGDFNNLKWEDEPVEVFINMED